MDLHGLEDKNLTKKVCKMKIHFTHLFKKFIVI